MYMISILCRMLGREWKAIIKELKKSALSQVIIENNKHLWKGERVTCFISLTEEKYMIANSDHEKFRQTNKDCFITVQFPQESARIKRCADQICKNFLKVL